MNDQLRFFSSKIGSYALLALIVAIASGSGAMIAHQLHPATSNQPPLPLHADTAVKGRTMSMATGLVSADVEGLYVLDHASGLLQCWILNPRTGAVGGIYQTNVIMDLGTDKVGAGDYLLASGGFAFLGGLTGNVVPSGSIIYVADEATGNVVGYSFSFNRQELNRGIMQRGMLRAVCKGPTRQMGTARDQ